jgi:citrate lyase subunit beta/citryl-CoA lyase
VSVTQPIGQARSYLYVPGDQRDLLDRVGTRGADAVIVDLEDAVAVSAKSTARAAVADWLSVRRIASDVWVRVNAGSVEEDLDAVVGSALQGVVVPKAEPDLLQEVHSCLSRLEASRQVERPLALIGLVETACGLLAAREVAASPRVHRLGIGEADLLAELRIAPSDTRQELTSLRLQVVVASAAAGIGAPIASTSTDFRDLDALRRSTEGLLGLGFRARTAIHPAQLATINEVFTPSAEQTQLARRVVEAYEAAERQGTGVVTDEHGRMVDVAVVRSSREVLERSAFAAN